MTARIEIKGLDKLVKKIDTLEKMESVKGAIKLGGSEIMKRMMTYPPQRQESTYVRTGALKHRWTIQTRDRGFTVIVGNNISYGRFVQSHEDQAWMHKDYWHTDKQVVEEDGGKVIKMVEGAINKIVNS